MVLPGEDFLASLRDLFDEAGAKGRNFDDNFELLKGPIIEFAEACGRMTAAKARAIFDPIFTDGRRPDTPIQLLPKSIKLNQDAVKRLRGADSRNEFIGIFRTVINESMPEKKTRKRKRPAAQAQPLPISEPTKPRPKIIVKKKSSSDSCRNETKEEKAWNDLKANLFYDMTKASPLAEFVRKPKGVHVSMKCEGESERLECRQDDPLPMDVDKNIYTNEVKTDLLPSQESSIKLEFEHENVEGSIQAEAEKTAAGSSLKHPSRKQTTRKETMMQSQDVEMAERFQTSDQHITQEDAMGNAESCEASTSKLEEPQIDSEHDLSCLTWTSDSEESIGGMVAEEVTEERIEDTLKLLKEGFNRIGTEIEAIPAERWTVYRTKLFDLCGLYDLLSMPFQERLSKIARIIYLQEEETALDAQDWSKLPIAVRICAFLAQTTGPVTDQRMVDGWVNSRLRDINFLVDRKIFDLNAKSEVMA